MTVVTLTSQGQISIPAKIRRLLSLENQEKLTLTLQGGKIILEPRRKFSELQGIIKDRALADVDNAMKVEDIARKELYLSRYKKAKKNTTTK